MARRFVILAVWVLAGCQAAAVAPPPIIIYVTPAPTANVAASAPVAPTMAAPPPTPQIIYVTAIGRSVPAGD